MSDIKDGIVPVTRPEATYDRVVAYADQVPVADDLEPPFLVMRRGYFEATFGETKNARGVYDDAMFLVSQGEVLGFNANGDPSAKRPGMARLKQGVYVYKQGIHNLSKDPLVHPRYPALVQAGEVTVTRDGGVDERGFFGINVHKGSYHTTSSEGCQTIYPDQWDEFFGAVCAAMTAAGVSTIKLIVADRSA